MSEIASSKPSDIGFVTALIGLITLPLYAVGFVAGAAFFWLQAGWEHAMKDMDAD